MPRSSPPRVVIVDADRRVQQSVSDLLRVTGRVEVAGCAGDVRSALELIEQAHPDAVLVDPRLPDVAAGTALINGVARAWPAVRIILTGWSGGEPRIEPTESDARYVSKDGTPDDFVSAIVAACQVS
jgi:DNA-binding NarL/FixJ family response regulator